MTIYLTHNSVIWQLGRPYLGGSWLSQMSELTERSVWKWVCGMIADGRVSLLSTVSCASADQLKLVHMTSG